MLFFAELCVLNDEIIYTEKHERAKQGDDAEIVLDLAIRLGFQKLSG